MNVKDRADEHVVPKVADEVDKFYGALQRGERLSKQFIKLDQRIQHFHNRVTFFNLDRNYKCPCKSGKKFKHCCIHHRNAAQLVLGKMEKAKVKLLHKIKQLRVDNGIKNR